MIGRGARIRTADLLRPRQARYQAAPRPEMEYHFILPSFFRGVQCESRRRALQRRSRRSETAAEVKSGVSRTAGYMLSHPAACALIREKAQRAMQPLAEFRPYKIPGPVEVKVEFTTAAGPRFELAEGVERVNERTWVFRGKDILDTWLKYGYF